jgi:hypothetical protein
MAKHLRSTKLPPIEVKQAPRTTSKAKVQVLCPRSTTNRAIHRGPGRPGARTRHAASADESTAGPAEAQLDLAATRTRRDTGAEGLGATAAERDTLDLDIVAVVDVRHRHAALAARLRLDALRPRNRLGLLAHVRVQRLQLRRPRSAHGEGGDAPVGIVDEALDGHGALVPAAAGEGAVVVEEVRVVLVIDDRGVICETASFGGHHDT